ncbi:sodium/calcium exchanger 1-like isoform X1 [Daphnia pulicaria]|uniref:sodium/calcium exchanger 1-like isoform X1 n=1 Tax=Daphnia pulicaria TaxID=35523 RepID=UPI001EEAB040|nr:sodium/calcium exchanger 1-like isoform X1 [Daphnia pulicaria]
MDTTGQEKMGQRMRRIRPSTTTSSSSMIVAGLLLTLCCLLGNASATSSSSSHQQNHEMTWANSSKPAALEDGQCQDGLIIPMWRPYTNLSLGDRVARGLVYFIAMCYLFVGVSIVADRFMGAIETITSQEKEIRVKKPNGDVQIVVVRVWNETVANLSLMALGSSAPEILLSIIEVYAKNFEAGDLGPGTIVGSAAFNLFMIIGLCVYVIPDGQVRKIKHLRVFFVTATWSIFAYVWLYIILAVISVGVVEVWEGILTFLFFPMTILTAYIADRRLLFYKYISKQYRINRRGVIVETEGFSNQNDIEMANKRADGQLGSPGGVDNLGMKTFDEEEMNDDVREFEEHRREYIQLLRDLRKKHPDLDMRAIEALAREELANSGPKSRAFYRIQATRKLTGGSNLAKKAMDRATSDLSQVVASPSVPDSRLGVSEGKIRIYFDPGHYTVMENVGEFAASVRRDGGDVTQSVQVDYKTEDGSANAGTDYIAVQGTLTFLPGETLKTFNVCVIDDDVFEEDEHFYIRLSNARPAGSLGSGRVSRSGSSVSNSAGKYRRELAQSGGVTSPVNGEVPANNSSSLSVQQQQPANGSSSSAATRSLSAPAIQQQAVSTLSEVDVELVAPFLATVMILDDDHCGIFNLADKDVELVESVGTYDVKVLRWSGARGRVAVPYRTLEGTAKEGKDYNTNVGEVIFENNEIEKYISLQILEEDSYEKDVLFYLEIDEPRQLGDTPTSPDGLTNRPAEVLSYDQKVSLLGRPKLGENTRLQIRVKESKEFKNTVDKLVQRANASLVVGSSSWKEQFIEAITVNPSEDEDEDGEAKMPSCGDYVLHFLTLFWKILFAFVPPTDRMNGWLCFVISIILIGVLTAIIGDVSSAFGCSVGLKDSVTAIAFVALGTSVPDMFASKVAAAQDQYADASVGNVTGSNAVNVFLGIGIAWSIAAIYRAYHGEAFVVPVGNLGFSVVLFCSLAMIALLVMMLRRSKAIGGELGGPRGYKIATSCLFVFLWLFYVLMSSLEAYGYINGF